MFSPEGRDTRVLLALVFPLLARGLVAAAQEPPSLGDLLNQKVVAASKYEQSVRDAPASVTIVTAQEIEEQGFDTLAEVLASVRSFYVSYDRNYAYIGARGFSRPTDYNDRILLLVDGHAINENTYGMAPLGTDFPIPLTAIERIEIVRGPGSALYGTYAMLAVLNVVTRTGASLDGIQASGELGSFGRKGASIAWGRPFSKGLDLMVSARYLDVDGQDLRFPEYGDEGGVARGVDGDRAFASLLSLKVGSTALRGGATWREKQVPTGSYDTIFGDPRSSTLDERLWVDVSHDVSLAFDKKLSLRAYLDRYFYEGRYPYHEGLLRDETDGLWAGGEARFAWDLRSSHRLSLGAEYRHSFRSTYAYETGDVPGSSHDIRSSVLSVYAEDELQLHRSLTATLGVRYDHFSVGEHETSDLSPSRGESEGELAPRAGLVLSFSKRGTLKLLYGEAFRLPSTYELIYQEKSGELDEERIRTLELDLTHELSPWLLGSASVYRYTMSQLIDSIAGGDGEIYYRNAGRATATGVEVQLDARFPGGLHGSLAYALQDADDAEGERLSNSPRQTLKVVIGTRLFSVLDLGARLRWESRRSTVYGTETGSYAVADLNLSARPIPRLALALTLRNVLDRRYATPGGLEHRQPGITQDGRSVVGRLSLSF